MNVSKSSQGHHSLVITQNLLSLLPYMFSSHPASLKLLFNSHTIYTPVSNHSNASHTRSHTHAHAHTHTHTHVTILVWHLAANWVPLGGPCNSSNPKPFQAPTNLRVPQVF